jgi:hypothetical protein
MEFEIWPFTYCRFRFVAEKTNGEVVARYSTTNKVM